MSLSKKDYEEFKSAVDKIVYKYVSRDRSTIVSLITHAVDSGTERRKLEEKLCGYVDKNLAYKLADKAFNALGESVVSSKLSRKRSHKDDYDKDTKRPRIKDDNDSNKNSDQMQPDDIKSMMAKAQATIEERKRAITFMGLQQTPLANAAMALGMAANLGPNAVSDVTSRIALLQSRIQTQLATSAMINPMLARPQPPGLMSQPMLSTPYASAPKPEGEQGEESKPSPLILDREGRTVDTSGKEVHITLRAPTLKANIRAKKREEFKEKLLEKPTEEPVETQQFFDPRVTQKSFSRAKRNFKFHDPGRFVQLGQRERAKSRLEKLQAQISQVARKTGISSVAKLAQLEQRDRTVTTDDTPDVEWWDAIILENDRYPDEGLPVKLKEDFITSLVEHPMEMKCPTDLRNSVELQVFLTKQERKKLRRMNRRETWKEKQEKIRLGLEPPPEPKVRMSNLMRVLGTEAVLDPTKMEKHVREQMAKRLKAHEDANAARKLTPEQRRQKKVDKLKEDTSQTGVLVAIYRVTDLTNGSHKFKIETNAKQLYMTGTVVLFKDVNVIVVEGGVKQQKKYKRLMMERIKWAEESRSKVADLEVKCQLVWEGVTQERSFGEMQFKSCPTETFARDHFKKHGVEHYWDLAYGRKVLEEAEEGA